MIPPASDWPTHGNSDLSGTTQLWYGLDNEEAFNQNCNNPHTYNKLKELGWLDSKINYTFNQQGFRSIEFDTDLTAGMAVGCSFTQGVGLPIEQTWPSIISQLISYPIWNLGVGGSSMDTAFRLVDYWLPILKPKFVLIACPSNTRIEICTEDGIFKNYLPNVGTPTTFYKEWIMNTANGEINFRKNLLAITAICNQHNTPLITLNVQDNFCFDHGARDLAHPSAISQTNFANKIIQKLKEVL